VSFTPSDTGQRTATLSITDNASNSPQTVSLTGTGCPDVILSWAASETPGVIGYDIYRGTASGGESGTPINSAPVNTTTYVDANVKAGTTYYYVLRAIAANGVQSPASNETNANVPIS
jgi:alpha-glucosidase